MAGLGSYPKVIEVIEVGVMRGKGTADDTMRSVTSYFSLDGEPLAESDPCPEGRVKPLGGWHTITYRGSGADLATDCIELLSVEQRGHFLERIKALTAGLESVSSEDSPR
jgi:hypothetical protein